MSGTRKYQCNGPVSWSATFREAAGRGGAEGEGIRAALAFALSRRDELLAFAGANNVLATGQVEQRATLALVAKPSPDDLLAAVRGAISRVGSDGRFGKDKVFIAALWKRVAVRWPSLSLDEFKSWLVTANRNEQVTLARADLVDAMDAKLVEESEISSLGATFHFVLDEPARTGKPAPAPKPHAVNPCGARPPGGIGRPCSLERGHQGRHGNGRATWQVVAAAAAKATKATATKATKATKGRGK